MCRALRSAPTWRLALDQLRPQEHCGWWKWPATRARSKPWPTSNSC